MKAFLLMVFLALASLVLPAYAHESLKVDTQGGLASILFEATIDGGHVPELKGKYKLRVTEIAIAAGGHIGDHNHLGPGIRQMTEGEMNYIMPNETVVYRQGGKPEAVVSGYQGLGFTGYGLVESGEGARRLRGRRISGRDNYFDKRRLICQFRCRVQRPL
jgi:hypothetical protein